MDKEKKKFGFFGYILRLIILAGIYIVAAKFGLSLAFSVKQVTTVWPPTGIALAALFLFGSDLWPGVLVGAFVANFLTAEPPLVAFGIAIGNTLEAVVGNYFLRKINFNPALKRLHDVLGLAVLAGFFSTAISATLGVLILLSGGLVKGTNFWSVWQIWWIGDMLGNLVVAPLIFSWSTWRYKNFRWNSNVSEAIALLAFTLIIFQLVFTRYNFYSFGIGPYIIFPLLIWIGLRFNQRAVSLAITAISGVAIWGTLRGVGPFGMLGDQESGLLSMQLFMAIVSITTMLLAAITTEREEADKDLEKIKLAVDNESDHVMITDPNGIILYVNKAAENITGYSAKEIIGKNAGQLWGGNMPKNFYDNMWREIKEKKHLFTSELVNRRKPSQPSIFVHEVINHRKNGQPYTVELKIAPILDSKGDVQFFVGVERDITKIKEIDRMKTDFISFASHQLRTPLTVIKWNTEMLKNGDVGKLSFAQKSFLGEIEKGENRMSQLIGALLNISRLESGRINIKPKSVDLMDLISSVISEVVPYAGSRHCAVIFNKPDQALPKINVDPALFRQVILNLLNNATHYSKPKKCKVEVDFKEVGEYYQVDVIDEGIGIPAGAQGKIFDKFYRADNAIKTDTDGTGLGLYLAKSIIETSGGKIWFESSEGKGSKFHFTIPKSGMRKVSGEKELSV